MGRIQFFFLNQCIPCFESLFNNQKRFNTNRSFFGQRQMIYNFTRLFHCFLYLQFSFFKYLELSVFCQGQHLSFLSAQNLHPLLLASAHPFSMRKPPLTTLGSKSLQLTTSHHQKWGIYYQAIVVVYNYYSLQSIQWDIYN